MPHFQYHLAQLRQLPFGVVRRITHSTCKGYSLIAPMVTGKRGLEIGGPSSIFRSGKLIPVYDRCQQIDNCNFAEQTIWDGASAESNSVFSACYVADACSMPQAPDGAYDFVLASHVLEHIANPLRALQEWKRILAPGGLLLIIVPHKWGTFDRKRPFTSFAHIESDFLANTAEDDLTHLNEILSLHDLRLDPAAGTFQQFKERCLNNYSVRAMHQHVFSIEVLSAMLEYIDMTTLNLVAERPYHLIAFAQKPVVEGNLEHAVNSVRQGVGSSRENLL
jgi:SAM-dependent methyltransferase